MLGRSATQLSRRCRADKSIESFRQNLAYGGDGTRIDVAYALYALSRGTSAEHVGAAIRSRDLSHKDTDRRQAELCRAHYS